MARAASCWPLICALAACTSSAPTPIALVDGGASDTRSPEPPGDTRAPDPPPDTSVPREFVTSCADWPAFTVATCMPTTTAMSDATALLSIGLEGTCTVSSVTYWSSLAIGQLLWFRDRRHCVRDLCFGFDSLHLGEAAAPELGYRFGNKFLGSALIVSTSSGERDSSAACGDFGCYKNFPLDTDITLTLELRSARREDEGYELCRTLDVVIRYSSSRELRIVAIKDH
jgi:hypothetical protein